MKSFAPPPDPETTAWRVWHDAPSGLWIDHFADRWFVQTKDARLPESVLARADASVASVYWRPRDKAAATAPTRVAGEEVAARFPVRESGAALWIDFAAGYSCGIFTDQRLNRRWVRERTRAGDRVLNTFAYTGGFSVMAALAGAETTTADLSGAYLDWTWENFALNGLDPKAHHGVKGDALAWLRTFARQGRRFEGVVLDPPTFSRSGRATFRTDRDYAELAALAAAVVAPGGWLLCCANTHRLAAERFRLEVLAGLRGAGRSVEAWEAPPMPPEFRGDDYLKTLRLTLG
jgi:23S rRNA (cytosine1962-C5)-methyltransferase